LRASCSAHTYIMAENYTAKVNEEVQPTWLGRSVVHLKLTLHSTVWHYAHYIWIKEISTLG